MVKKDTMIYLGDKKIKEVYLGSKKIAKVYMGSKKVHDMGNNPSGGGSNEGEEGSLG